MTEPTTINKVLNVGTTDIGAKTRARVFVRVEFDGRRLSLTGVEGPLASGNCRGGCGQIDLASDLRGGDLGPGQVRKLREIWDRWHLNDARAGTPAQMEYMRGCEGFPGYPASHYEWTLSELASAGLQPDPETGYSYGSAWLFEEVPAEVIDWLAALPASSVPYHWA